MKADRAWPSGMLCRGSVLECGRPCRFPERSKAVQRTAFHDAGALGQAPSPAGRGLGRGRMRPMFFRARWNSPLPDCRLLKLETENLKLPVHPRPEGEGMLHFIRVSSRPFAVKKQAHFFFLYFFRSNRVRVPFFSASTFWSMAKVLRVAALSLPVSSGLTSSGSLATSMSRSSRCSL